MRLEEISRRQQRIKGDYSKFNANKGNYKNPSESFGGIRKILW